MSLGDLVAQLQRPGGPVQGFLPSACIDKERHTVKVWVDAAEQLTPAAGASAAGALPPYAALAPGVYSAPLAPPPGHVKTGRAQKAQGEGGKLCLELCAWLAAPCADWPGAYRLEPTAYLRPPSLLAPPTPQAAPKASTQRSS